MAKRTDEHASKAPARRILVVGTADTKGEELAFIAARIRAAGGDPLVVDVGTGKPAGVSPDIANVQVARHGPDGTAEAITSRDRGRAVASGYGAALAMNPLAAVAMIPVAALVVGVTRIMSVMSITMAPALALLYIVLAATDVTPWAYAAYASGAAALIVYKHRPNIERLIAGTEPRIGRGA